MKFISISIIIFLIISCSQEHLSLQPDTEQELICKTEKSESCSAVVKFDEEFLSNVENDLMANRVLTKSSDFNELQQRLGVVSLKRMFPYAEKYEARTRAEGLHRWYIVTYESSIPYTKASSDFMNFNGIDVVEPLCPVVITDFFDDPWIKYQWHYYNDGRLSPSHQSGVDINVMPVWERYTMGSDDVIVAVIDGGIDQSHEDLAENCIGGYNFVSNSPLLTPHYHGTHVAGTIGAVNNNGIGVAGIAGGNKKYAKPGVRLLSCQIFQETSGEDDSVDGSHAIKWAADNGAVIAQNSWGFDSNSYSEAKKMTIPEHLKDAIDYFIKYAGIDENGNQVGPMKGGVVLFSAGNSGWDTDPIGLYQPVIAVGAIGPEGYKASYSNYGSWVDISAPGGDRKYVNGMVYSTLPNNQYGELQGTSMSCPHVSGVAALLVSYYGGSGFTADELKRRLLAGANDSYPDTKKIGPVVDALGSMTYGNQVPPDPVTDLTVTNRNGRLNFEWSVTADQDEGVAYGYRIFVAKRKSDLQNLVFDAPFGVGFVEVMTKLHKVGDKLSAEYSNVQLGQTYYVTMFSFDRHKNVSSVSDIVTVKLPENMPPDIIPMQDMSSILKVGAHDSYELLFNIKDSDNLICNITLRNAISISGLIEKEPGVYSVVVTGNANIPGKYVATLVVSDELAAISECQINYELLPNMHPVLNFCREDTLLTSLEESIILNLSDYFTDPDAGTLEYEVHLSDPTILQVSHNGDNIVLHPVNYGIADVFIVASDSYGASTEMRFKVAVKNGSDVLIYPNPVSDFLNISVSKTIRGNVKISSQSGNVEYKRNLILDPFRNIKIDMRGYPTGKYHLSIEGENISIEKQLIKL